MQRIATLLFCFGIIFGLSLLQPALAFASPTSSMDMAAMSQADMSAMPDCMASMMKHSTPKPCKCGLAGCIAMMTSGVSMMLADGSAPLPFVIARAQFEHAAIVAALHGRSTAPEPEPPSILA